MIPHTYKAVRAALGLGGSPAGPPGGEGAAPAMPGQEGAHGAGQAAEHAVQGAHGETWDVETMIHHVADDRVIDLGFAEISLEPLSFDPVHIGGLTVDLSVTRHVVFLFIATILTIVTMWLAARKARGLEQGDEAPGGLLNAIEAFYLYLRDEVAMRNIGAGGERFVPLVITLFFFILYANLLGLVPFGATATGNIMVTSALALISMVVIEVAGFRELGARGYLGTIFFLPPGLPVWLRPVVLLIMTPVELIGKFSKIVALAIRLFANMTAGHFVLLALLGLIITYGGVSAIGVFAIVGPILLGLFVMFLEIFIAFIQAYIFAMLTAVFIGLIRHAH